MEEAAEIVGDGTGATLDAVLGAVAAASASQGNFHQVPHDVPRSEGWIYSVPEEPWRR
jgi:outer membrane lipoprotein SlyB